MLDFFDVALDHNAAGGDNRAGYLGRRGPSPKTADRKHQRGAAEQIQLANPNVRAVRQSRHVIGRHVSSDHVTASALAAPTTLSRALVPATAVDGVALRKIS